MESVWLVSKKSYESTLIYIYIYFDCSWSPIDCNDLVSGCLRSRAVNLITLSLQLPFVTHLESWKVANDNKCMKCKHHQLLNAIEGPPTLQSSVIPAWNYVPQLTRKSHPNFFAHCKRSTKMKKYKKTIIPNVQNTIRTQVTPMVLN